MPAGPIVKSQSVFGIDAIQKWTSDLRNYCVSMFVGVLCFFPNTTEGISSNEKQVKSHCLTILKCTFDSQFCVGAVVNYDVA